LPHAEAARFTLLVEEDVYTPGETMVVYGAGAENDVIIVRMFGPTGQAISISNIITDSEGFFRESLYHWKDPVQSIPFGSYTIEAISSFGSTDIRRVDVTFQPPTRLESNLIPLCRFL
jgi:hypothetical protein